MLSRLVGRLLRGFSAGESKLLWNHPSVGGSPVCIELSSPAFVRLGTIPLAHAGHGIGGNRSPALNWSGVPDTTQELLLIVEDADAPLPKAFVHAIATGIPAGLTGICEGALNGEGANAVRLGRNTFGRADYAGPRALPGHGPHRYSFQLLALSGRVLFDRPPTRDHLLKAIEGKVVGRGRLDGIFERV